jgi:Leucine-rich repeat (LRR) protein
MLLFMRISAVGYGLNGPIPDKLGNVAFLYKLKLAGNNITGTIPQSIHFRYLNDIFVGGNQLTGEVPIQLYQQSRLLHRYFFPYNQFHELNSKYWPADVKLIMCEGSNYSQPLLDTQVERFPSLSMLDLSNTKLSGKIPLAIWNLPFIALIEFTQNFLTGRLPQQPVPSNLQRLQLDTNQMTGPIPEAFVASKENKIDSLLLSGNRLVGTIPNNISNLHRLFELTLDNNQGLYGAIPSEFGTIDTLHELSFVGTGLTGNIPIELCNLKSVDLGFLRADCLIDQLTGMSQVSCEEGCCTTCCDANGTNCIGN